MYTHLHQGKHIGVYQPIYYYQNDMFRSYE